MVLFVGKLLPINYPSDIYNIIELGYIKYANSWFAKSGRVMCMLVFYIMHILNIELDSYIFIMKIFSIIFAISSIYMFYNILIQVDRNTTIYKRIGYLLATITIFINFSSYQFFYYTESGVMWLGILLVVLAIKTYFFEEKKYVKEALLLFFSVICYQSMILIYIPSIILISFMKNKLDKKDFLINTLIVLINLIIGYVIVVLFRKIFNTQKYIILPLSNIGNLKLLYNNIHFVLLLYNDNFPIITVLLLNYSIIVYEILKIVFSKENKKYIAIPSVIIYILCFVEVIAITTITRTYLADRILFAYIASIGFNLCYLTKNSNSKIEYIIIILISLFWIIVNCLNSYNLTSWSYIAKENDKIIGKKVYDIISNYEKQNNIVLNKIEYCYDKNSTRVDYGIRRTEETTCRAFFGDWIIDNVFNYYCPNHEFITKYNQDIYEKIFKNKDWDNFSEEQFEFSGDILYYCIY